MLDDNFKNTDYINVYFPGNEENILIILSYLEQNVDCKFSTLIKNVNICKNNDSINVARIIFIIWISMHEKYDYYNLKTFKEKYFSKTSLCEDAIKKYLIFVNCFINSLREIPTNSLSFKERMILIEVVYGKIPHLFSLYKDTILLKICSHEYTSNHIIRDLDGFLFK